MSSSRSVDHLLNLLPLLIHILEHVRSLLLDVIERLQDVARELRQSRADASPRSRTVKNFLFLLPLIIDILRHARDLVLLMLRRLQDAHHELRPFRDNERSVSTHRHCSSGRRNRVHFQTPNPPHGTSRGN